MDKSPDAFRTISEAADELDLPQHVLRFWETRFTNIRPLKRGGGRRYYRPEDVLLLKGIRHLLYDQGFTIKGVLRILKEHGARQVIAIGDGQPLDSLGAPLPADRLEDGLDSEELALDAALDTEDFADDADAPPRSARAQAVPAPPAGLSPADRQSLEKVLRDLLDCKRLLERARDT